MNSVKRYMKKGQGMYSRRIRILFFLLLVCNSCTTFRDNPLYLKCSRKCVTSQNRCMLNAESSAGIDFCKSVLNNCIKICGSKYALKVKDE